MITLNYNGTTLQVQPDDSSYIYRAMMIDDEMMLKFSLASFIDFPIGTYVIHEGQTYTMEQPPSFVKNGTRRYEYTLTLYADYFKGNKYKFRNMADGRLKFDISATPAQMLTMIVQNLNARNSGWIAGTCITAEPKVMEFNHVSVLDALRTVAEVFDTEFHISGKTVSIGRIERNAATPLALSYDDCNIIPGVKRGNYDGTLAIERLYVQGGERNIDASIYGARTLHLPKGKTYTVDGVSYTSDANGLYIEKSDVAHVTNNEDSLEADEYYPHRVGTVSSVVTVDEDTNLYDIVDSGIPNALDYNDCAIVGSTMTIIFQSGAVAGREFEVNYFHEAAGGKAAKRFEIVPMDEDGMTFPSETFKPAGGDTYIVYNVQMPDAYIEDDDTHTGASWEMFIAAAKHLAVYANPQYSYSAELCAPTVRENWDSIKSKLVVGGAVTLSDTQFLPEGVTMRIVNVKMPLNYPYDAKIEFSNKVCGQGQFSSGLRKADNADVMVEASEEETISFTKRRYRAAIAAQEMLGNALLKQFTESVSPVTINTMQTLVGANELQYSFIAGLNDPTVVEHNLSFNAGGQLVCPSAVVKHETIGIEDVKASRGIGEYVRWSLGAETLTLADDDKAYYLYLKVDELTSAVAGSGSFIVSADPLDIDEYDDYYCLLYATIGALIDGEREIYKCNGFTEIAPGRITAYKFLSPDGVQYINFLDKSMHLGDANSYMEFSAANAKLSVKGSVEADGNNFSQGSDHYAIKTNNGLLMTGGKMYAVGTDAMIAANTQGNGDTNIYLHEGTVTVSRKEAGQSVAKSGHIVDGGAFIKHIAKVGALPAMPDDDTLYIVMSNSNLS